MVFPYDVSSFIGSVVCIGNFDGMHPGHQALLQRAKQEAEERDVPVLVITFEPHPRTVLNPQDPVFRLMTAEEREFSLMENGADSVWTMPFTEELSKWSPEKFIDDLLVGLIHASAVVVGEGFRFGYKGAGHVVTLEACGQFDVIAMPPVCDEAGERYSSTRLRTEVLGA